MIALHLLAPAVLLAVSAPVWAQDESAPGLWRGRQLTTPPPPPIPLPAPVAAVVPWTPPPPVIQNPPAGTAAAVTPVPPVPPVPPVDPGPPPPPGSRGIERVPVTISPSMASPHAAVDRPSDRSADVVDPDGVQPRRAFNYNAYALDFGQVELGVGRVALGLAPRVQVSTNPVLDGLGAWNVQVQANIIRGGPVDITPVFAGYRLADAGEFEAGWISGGLRTSIVATPRWSLHFGGSWDWLAADGIPQSTTLYPFLWTDAARQEADEWVANANAINADLRVRQMLVTIRVATDIRLTRRDSIVVQASAIPFGSSYQQLEGEIQGQTVGLPPILQLDELLIDTDSNDLQAAVANSYVVSLAYQASWDHLQLRLGIGKSATNLAWLLPSFQLAWRFGGFNLAQAPATPPTVP